MLIQVVFLFQAIVRVPLSVGLSHFQSTFMSPSGNRESRKISFFTRQLDLVVPGRGGVGLAG